MYFLLTFDYDLPLRWSKPNLNANRTRSNVSKHESPCLTTFPNNEKRVENTTRSGVFLAYFEVFGNLVKYCLECLIYLDNRN